MSAEQWMDIMGLVGIFAWIAGLFAIAFWLDSHIDLVNNTLQRLSRYAEYKLNHSGNSTDTDHHIRLE